MELKPLSKTFFIVIFDEIMSLNLKRNSSFKFGTDGDNIFKRLKVLGYIREILLDIMCTF